MNKERILALADVIEQQPHVDAYADSGFSMESVWHGCGTPCCIAGWANGQFGDRIFATTEDAMRLLGLSEQDRENLFFAKNTKLGFDEITPSHAAAVLRNLAATGQVDWSVGAPAEVA